MESGDYLGLVQQLSALGDTITELKQEVKKLEARLESRFVGRLEFYMAIAITALLVVVIGLATYVSSLQAALFSVGTK